MWWRKTATAQPTNLPARSALVMALEPRMLFDGAVAATVAETADAQPIADASHDQASLENAHSSADNLAATPTGTTDNRQEVVFIDNQVKDYQQLISGLKPGSEVVVLDGSKDGLQQIADYLNGRSGIDAIHIISHGDVGKVQLGNDWLDSSDLASRSATLNAIGQALDKDGDILLYGCQVGANGAGRDFIEALANATGADVAASDNLTGATSKGGDWVLEVNQGSIETVVVSGTDGFNGLLAVAADENYDDNALGVVAVANTFTLDGLRYTITGNNTYTTDITNDPNFEIGGISDYFLRFDGEGKGGISSIKVEMADGSVFSLAGFSLEGAADSTIEVTTSTGGLLSYNSNDLVITRENVNTGGNAGFQNITSFTISGGNLWLALDDLSFAPAAPTLVSATFSDSNLKVGETSTVTFTFSTAIAGFTTADLTVPNGSISGLNSSDGGLTWTGLFTPGAGVTDSDNVITVDLSGVSTASGGVAGVGTATSSNYAIDTLAPSVTSVTSSTANGTYKVGDVISVQVTFGENVTVAGTPQLTLETGSTDRTINYAGGSGTNTLTFNYTVQAGDSAADLDYISSGALALNGGSIRDAAGNDATLTLATPGTTGSLGANKDIVINSAPAISNINGDSVAWAGAGNTVTLDAGGNAQFSDTEFGALNGGNGNWAGASLTIQRNGTALSSDVLSFNTIGALFTISGSNLQSNGQTFATFTNAGGVLAITFTSSGTDATTALVNDVAQRITYRNDTPAGDTTIRYSLNDGTSTVTADVVVTSDIIYVTNTNDTATIDLSNGVSFSEAVAIAAADVTGSQTIVFASNLAGQALNLNVVALNESLTFDMTQANGMTLTGSTITLAGGTTQVFNVGSGYSATISSVIAGTGALTKAGAGELTLSNSNTNAGTTTVSAGTLVVDGSTSSATTVASGSTLAGSGTLGGDVTVQNGGTLSPGNSGAGTLTVNGNLTLDFGSTLALDINGATAGTGYDRVVVNGVVDVSGATLAVNHGYAAGSGDSYTVIVNDAADAVVGTFSGISEGGKFNTAGNGTELTTSYTGGTGNDLTLTAPIAPTITNVSSSTANGTYKIGDVITVNVQFDSAVNVAGIPTLTLETGATDRVLNYVSGSGTNTLSFSYTVQAGDSSADLDYVSSSALSLNGGSIRDGANQSAILTLAAPGAAGSLGANKALVVDGVRPAATNITLSDTALSIGETATVTITFAERVVGLDTADFTVAGGTLTGLSSADGGLTWTATFTPDSNLSDATNVITLDNTGVMDLAGNIGSGTTDSVNYAIDTQRPTASIVVTDTALRAGQSTTVTITFSEAVVGLTTADFIVANATLSNLTTSDNITWTATLTPGANVTDATNLITLDNFGYTDIAGNPGGAPTDSNNYAIDTQRPTAISVLVTDTTLKAGQSTTVTITFSETVTGLDTGDFSVANGTLSNLSSSDGGLTWTATLTPDADVTDATNLITLDNTGYTDAAGNTGTGATDSNNYVIDSQRPTVSIVVGNTSLSIGDSTTVTITFSEAVTGLTIADFTVANGALSNLSSNDGGVTWTATLTPSADVASPTNLITLANTGYTDTVGNTGSSPTDSNNYSVDTQRPTATIVVNDTVLAAGETTTVTVTFNEAISGLTLANFAVANGVLSNLSTSDNITWTATLTPSSNVTDTTNLVTLDNTGVQDTAGNAGVGTTDSNNYAIDTQRPTAGIVITDTALKAGQSTTVTITFSEVVTGLTTADFSVANGTLGNLSSSDGGITWTATLMPDADVTDATNLITLDNTGYTDAAGNTGTGTTTSNNYTIDTQRPTATIVVNDTALAVGETTAVTITFNEAVTGLSLADFSVANGTLSNLSTTDNITYTAILTPNGNIADSSNVITLNNTGVQDAAGNIGGGSTNSNNYAIDTQRPTATIQLSDTALAAGETATVTITFNEAVAGLSLADLSASNGTLSGLSSNDGGITWTAILTPAANVTASSNLITLNNTGVQDAAGNTGIGGTLSGNYAVDTVVPVIGSVNVPVGVQYNAGDTLTFVVNASEAILVNGAPRLALDIGGATVFADYIAGSGTTTLVFQYSVQPGLNDADGITVTGLQSNGGSLRDATGNAMNLTLNNVGDTSGVRIDTTAPTAALALDQAASSAGNVRYTLTFSEDVSGVDLSDFSLVSTGNAQGTLSGLVQIDARTYQITISNVVGSGSLALALNSSGTGISDSAGNALIGGLLGQPYTQNQTAGDPEFRANPTPNVPTTPTAPPQPNVPGAPPSSATSPLLPPPLFEQPTLGSGVPTVGNIFINNGALAPSFIAQVFASSDSGAGNGSGIGFLGFGGGDGGVFGTSSFSSMFNKDVPLESGEIQLRWGTSSGNGLGGGEILGAPTLSQQLQEIGESEQRQIRELAWALGEIPLQMPQA
ncbi:Ig-like domain-containing protein [Pseudomonas chengduensis]|nr:Ig-like domain-containing protein [Pseudomonas chengduensis]MDH1210085.1 Ig-like domain-containing protein [Pseudomonas chengduensis]MDH1279625.1 Ig-like domain-containing protein [Pseudomonas chengduensis]MDH1681780.1 Ig-like domain-containing protein [Pseudomonas chengduensis]